MMKKACLNVSRPKDHLLYSSTGDDKINLGCGSNPSSSPNQSAIGAAPSVTNLQSCVPDETLKAGSGVLFLSLLYLFPLPFLLLEHTRTDNHHHTAQERRESGKWWQGNI